MKHENIIYTELENYPGYYISKDTQQILSVKKGKRVLKSSNSNTGYLRVTPSINGTVKYLPIHRAMAETFLPKVPEKLHVNHIDGNKHNNSLSNLEWVTPKENAEHANYHQLNRTEHLKKKIYQYQIDGKFIRGWESVKNAANSINGSSGNISSVSTGNRDVANGYRWSHKKTAQLEVLPNPPKVVSHYLINNSIKVTSLDKLAKLLKVDKRSISGLFKLKSAISENEITKNNYNVKRVYYK